MAIEDEIIIKPIQNLNDTVTFENEIVKKTITDNEATKVKQKMQEEDEQDTDSCVIQVEDDTKEGEENEENLEEDEADLAQVSQKQANTYAAKKTVAQGMMDIALITANANQLRYIIEFNSNSSTYYLNLFLITISLLLQVGVGVSLIFKGKMDLKGESKHKNAKKINNYVVVGVFLVTIINVFIASFTITGSDARLIQKI